MSLPNYSPSGKILFGSVPWDNGYTNVRLYTDTGTQYSDISSRMTVSSDNYTYIGRNRRIKVSIEADRLYHCNYCMYRNDSLTDGYIYCFVTDVKYINDNTSEITIETDVFQTYLYSVDWTIPACFIERETTPSEDDKYLLTNEPDFPLQLKVVEYAQTLFKPKGIIAITGAKAITNDSVTSLFEGHWTTEAAKLGIMKGVFTGVGYYYIPYLGSVTEQFENFFNGLMYAGSTESIAAVYTVPDFYDGLSKEGWIDTGENVTDPDKLTDVQGILNVPQNTSTVDGYSPHNKKLLYYPYTRVRLTDQNGSSSELKYEFMGNRSLDIKYAPSPSCQALVYPDNYMGMKHNFENGILTQCGTWCSWSNNAYENWLAQNAGTIALTVAGIALSAYTGSTSIAAASEMISLSGRKGGAHFARPAHYDYQGLLQEGRQMAAAGESQLGSAASGAASLGAQLVNASKAPVTTRGQVNCDSSVMTGVQGVWAEKVQVRAEIAQQIDQFFDRFGYNVERIESVNITSRPAWNYVKTGGAAPRSTNMGAGSSAPFTRGRGTPADALSIIRQAFDNGVTFWHTTSNFGNYQQSNTL